MPFLQVIVASTTLLAQAPPSTAPPASQPVSNEFDSYAGPRLLIRAPDAIELPEYEGFLVALNASEAQSLYLAKIFDEYRLNIETLQGKYAQEMARTSVEGGRANSPHYSEEGIAAQDALTDLENRYLRDLAILDEKLFADTAVVLGESQISSVERLRMRRERDRCTRSECMLLSARIDLTRLLDAVADGETRREAYEFCVEYERLTTPLFVRLDKELRRTVGPFMRLCMAEQSLHRGERTPDFNDRLSEIHAGRERILETQAKLQREITDLNDRFAPEIAARLPETAGTEFLRNYRAFAYQVMYPDYLDPHPTIDALIAADNGPLERRQKVRAVKAACEPMRRAILREMEDSFNKWRERFAATLASGGPVQDQYQQRMREMRSKLWEVDRKAINDVLALMPEFANSVEVQKYRELDESMVRRATKDGLPGS